MPYAFTLDVPATDEIYQEIRAQLPAEAPDGLIVHLVTRGDLGLRYIDVWESKQAWEQVRDTVLVPAVVRVLASHGIPHDDSATRFEEIDALDVWQPGVAVAR
jgi:hypothetical protein